MKHIFSIITAFFFTSTLAYADIIMGIVPQQSPLKLMQVWSPVAKYLSEKTGEKIVFKTEKSIDRFEEVLFSGGYDFAYMSPFHYVFANTTKGYIAGARSDKDIKGILVMREGDSFEKIKDKKAKYLFPSANAFAATLLTKYDLINDYNVDVDAMNNFHYVNSHDSVYKGVSRGVGDIGGGIERTFDNISDLQLKNSLHIVYTTKAYPSHPFAFKSDMDKVLKDKIVTALVSMPKEILNNLSMDAIKAVNDEEYRSVKELAKRLNLEVK